MMQTLFPFKWRNALNLKYYGIALLIFLLGILMTFLALRFFTKQEKERTHLEFERLADLRLFLIEDSLSETLKQLDYLKQFFASSGEVTRQDFHIFSRLSFNYSPDLIALAWVGENPDKNSSLGFHFADLTKIPSLSDLEIFPLKYLDTLHPGEPLYIDHQDYSKFLNFFHQSKDQTQTTVSTPINYYQNEEKQGLFLFKSVFSQSIFLGTLIGFSNFDEIIQSMRSRLSPIGINIAIYDITEPEQSLLYWSPATFLKDPLYLSSKEVHLQKEWSRDRVLNFGDRKLKLEATPTLEFINVHQDRQGRYWEALIAGILISSLISSYFLSLVNKRLLIEREVKDRTIELEKINSILQQEITERQQIEMRLTKSQEYLKRRHDALDFLNKFTISEPQHAIHEVTMRTASVMQVDRVGVWFYKVIDSIEILTSTGFYFLSTKSFSGDIEFTSTSYPEYFKALASHSPLILPSPSNAELNHELASYLATFEIRSKMDIPILFEGHLLGILSCEETRGHREWILEDRHFGQAIADIIAIMITESERRKAEKALQVSEERLSFITQKSIDGIISFNDKQEIVSWNLGAERIFGYTEEQMLGKPLRAILPFDDSYFQDQTSTKPIELKGQHKEGHLFPIEVSQTHWEKGKLHFDTIIFRDMTERKENEKRIIKAMREAKAANETKNEFLATISHELRTPLNAIIGFNQCLLMGMDGSINDQQEISLKRIEKSSFHLLNLINNILDLAKIEAHRTELEIMPYNIVEVIKSCIEEMHPLAVNKKLSLTFPIDHPFVIVEFDKMRIRQVLLNLLSNAIKFTEQGSITVILSDYSDHIDIQVIDTGIGLTSEEIQKLFIPFSQADSSITRKYGGTGLGLIISKNMMALHNGTIFVRSEKGKGSTFTIAMPKKQNNS